MLGGFATSSPSASLAGAVSAGVLWNRWSLSLSGDLAFPDSVSVTINRQRSGTLTAYSFSAALAVGYCWGSVVTFCPALAGGLRGLAVQPTGTLYQQSASLAVIPSLGLDLQLHWRVSPQVALGLRVSPRFPLGTLQSVVEGTSARFSTSLVEGTFGLTVAWSPGFAFF